MTAIVPSPLPPTRLLALDVRNYIGAGGDGARIDAGGRHLALCGPNNSGKTTMVAALSALRVACPHGFHTQLANHNDGRTALTIDWKDAGGAGANDSIHRLAGSARFDVTFAIAADHPVVKSLVTPLQLTPVDGMVAVRFALALRSGQQQLLLGLSVSPFKVVFV
jgi:hypothetical protein